MAGQVCDSCGAVVGVDDQFCPNCGSWIDPTTSSAPVGDDYESFQLGDQPPVVDGPRGPVRLPQQEIQCPSCGTPNPVTNRHCEECGARLSQGALPVAPRPAVQTTAGVRAAMAISALLLGVVLIAMLFRVFSPDEETPEASAESSTTTTTAPAPTPEIIPILAAECSIPGLANLGCDNLIDGTTEREYQINWEDLGDGEEVVIKLKFQEPMVLTSILWGNIPADNDRFYQNYRARNITITDGSIQGLGHKLENQGGEQPALYYSVRTLSLTITITDVYAPEPRDNQVFSDLAIAEIQVLGYPATQQPTTTTTGGDGS